MAESRLLIRDTQSSLADYDKSGQKLWQFLHGEKADHVRGLLDEIYPDMGIYLLLNLKRL